jgi:hypothetical protein
VATSKIGRGIAIFSLSAVYFGDKPPPEGGSSSWAPLNALARRPSPVALKAEGTTIKERPLALTSKALEAYTSVGISSTAAFVSHTAIRWQQVLPIDITNNILMPYAHTLHHYYRKSHKQQAGHHSTLYQTTSTVLV